MGTQARFCPHLWEALEASKEGRNMRDAGSILELCIILIITEYIGKVLMVWIRVVVVQVQVGELAVFLKGFERTYGRLEHSRQGRGKCEG